MSKTFTYKAEEIFEDIPGDDENILMNIPQEILDEKGWVEGTNLKFEIGDQGTVIITEVKENDDASEIQGGLDNS
ncbi:MAG: hypothetical protein VW551_03825 [Euryarchaeota archaeon]|jgi:hypothetical protein